MKFIKNMPPHEKPELQGIPKFLGKNGYIPRRCSSRFQSFPYWSEGVNTTIRRRGEVMRIRVLNVGFIHVRSGMLFPIAVCMQF